MTHTLGPWTIHQDGGKDKYICGSADVRWPRVCTITATPDKAEEHANARLIAAAPALLAACERAKGFVDSWGKKLGDWDAVDQNTINAINAAIAQAKGGA